MIGDKLIDPSAVEYSFLLDEFLRSSARWRPLLAARPALDEQQMYADFANAFSALDERRRHFWAISCCAIVVASRARQASEIDEGILSRLFGPLPRNGKLPSGLRQLLDDFWHQRMEHNG